MKAAQLEIEIDHILESGANSIRLIELFKRYATKYAYSLPVFRICNHCNTEFELSIVNGITERVCAFQNCTHCGKRNDTWISIKIKTPVTLD